MANFAKIDNGIVTSLIVVSDDVINGADFIVNELGLAGTWLQCNDGGVGYAYDASNDVFIAPQPYPSWTLGADFFWEAPVPKPGDNYYWDEDLLQWLEPTIPNI